MVNPGAFRGARKEFLMKEKPNYSAGVIGGYAGEALAAIQRRYFKRFPIDLPHDEEPSSESLAAVNDDAPDADVSGPDEQRMTVEQFKAAMDLVEERRCLLAYRKAQIKRWLAYQHMKDNDLNPKDSGAYNPYNALMVKLTGKEVSRPRLKTAANVWRKTKRDEIEAELKRRLGDDLKEKKERLVTERDKIAREMFKRLSEEEQRHWKGVAVDEHNDVLKEYQKELELANNPSTAPADRQRCIQGLVRFAQPILDIICDVTGWKATLMVGGPEPAQDGKLNIISIHSGTTTGDVKMTFGCAERERYKKYVVPIFGSFLQKCYTPEECRSRALNPSDGFQPMATLDLDEKHAFIHSYDTPSPTPSTESNDFLSTSPTSTLVDEPSHRPPSSKTAPLPSDDRAATPITGPTKAPLSSSEEPQNPVTSLSLGSTNPPTSAVSLSPNPGIPTVEDEVNPFPFDAQSDISPASPPRHPLSSALPTRPTALQKHPSDNPPPVPSPGPSPGPSPVPSPARSPERSTPLCAPFPRSSPVATSTVTNARRSTRSAAPTVESEVAAPTAPVTRNRNKRSNDAPDTPATQPANEGQERKRRKTIPKIPLPHPAPNSASTSAPAPIQAHNKAPEWFDNALSMLQSAALGPEWVELIEKWSAFEVNERYKEAGKIGSLHRPASVGDWIKRGRSSTWRPEISSASKYGKEYVKWWTSLQPAWRLSASGKIIPEATDGDWNSLRKPGTNGLLSVVCGLFHWGTSLQKNGEEVKQSQWIAAVKDCILVYDCLLQ
ncbi:hypothetical protein BDN70DRAFT_939329 [Pholiota conissans]|uniref:Uncharacterized protein n=1 Tax=Pholiota conissans TaxID=109636 RepID=A0A9P5YL53_9AGAR|nr:hypothetical protein BDN70DRAFT_939329 [Pholiota conissans]